MPNLKRSLKNKNFWRKLTKDGVVVMTFCISETKNLPSVQTRLAKNGQHRAGKRGAI